MGLRGPPPKPSVIEIAEGFPGKRGVNPREPKPGELGVQEAREACPDHLPEQYRKWWEYYAAILAGIRVLTEADLVMLGKLARGTGERVEQEEQYLKTGPLYKSPKSGHVRLSPMYLIVTALREQESKLLREFGMSPSSRTRVNAAGPANAVDSLEAALA